MTKEEEYYAGYYTPEEVKTFKQMGFITNSDGGYDMHWEYTDNKQYCSVERELGKTHWSLLYKHTGKEKGTKLTYIHEHIPYEQMLAYINSKLKRA